MSKTILAAIAAVPFLAAGAASAAVVDYSGRVFEDPQGRPTGGAPHRNGFVIAGTFAPGYDPFRYAFSIDTEGGNIVGGEYDKAVADGDFFPIGTGGLTDAAGAFALSGTTAADPGTPIWLFAFDRPVAEGWTQVLATSPLANWRAPAADGTTSLAASEAETFVLGRSNPQGVALSIVPFPEPTAALAWLGLALLPLRRTRRAKVSVGPRT